ncbi:MAG: carboxypeptidase-like regulatory domain-containing protein [Aquabacterium sp.]|uniref:carboxypeptidase-like regulatory domain-containing protein n=1 Tax=Aquabacterium sp. TaxID=1872578 RepID=UPI00271B9E0F|nr:carboxypeptidase-like regulatory domain-containing protein [Aquabacterium sp.]MDO9006128.1 carboxypeptidase-like regulatory domain-containing protein [Aquabacterium sp.]
MAIISNTGQKTYKSDLQGAFETLQDQRSDLLGMVLDAQLASRLLIAEEARRLRSDVNPDDPRVKHYANASKSMLQRVAALEVEVQIANIRVPPVTKTETLLQGRITDESSKAAAQVQVTLIDEAGKPVAGVAPATTDASGYYAFILQPAQVDAIGANRKLTLQIGSENGKLVPQGSKPFSLNAGQMTAHETKLQAGELDKLKLRPAFTDVAKEAPKPRAAPGKSTTKATKNPDNEPEVKPAAAKRKR